LDTAAQLLSLAAAAAVGWLLKSFMPSYFSEKGKNLATKEDVGEITRRIEEVKAAIGSRIHVYQVRYEHEFKILLELSEKLVAVRDAAQGLRPEASYEDINDPEVKKARMAKYIEAARELYLFVETRQPFFPEQIYQAIKVLDQVSWREFVAFKIRKPDEGLMYWDSALKNGAEIGKIASAGLLLIRDRIQRWEAFDPAP
jgi:hypothetical protein